MPLHGFIQVDGKKESVDSDHVEMSFGVTPSAQTHEAAGSSEPTTVTSSFNMQGSVFVSVVTIRNSGGQTTTTTTTDTSTHTTTTTTTTTDSSGNTHSTIEIKQK